MSPRLRPVDRRALHVICDGLKRLPEATEICTAEGQRRW
jgi:hypothetical protein